MCLALGAFARSAMAIIQPRTQSGDMSNKPCPIGMECIEHPRGGCPNEQYCNGMAAPWPMPYQIWEIDYYYDKGALVVAIPYPTNWDEVPNNEWDILSAQAYDDWINYIRRELKEAGWQNPQDLPYSWDEIRQCLVVDLVHICKEGDPEEGFAPAVSVDNWRRKFSEEIPPDRFDEWGFYLNVGRRLPL